MELIKKNNVSLYKEIDGLKLFRNDIDKIIGIYTSEGYSVSLNDDEYTYDDLNDYVENNGTIIKKLLLEFRKEDEGYRNISIQLAGNTANIRASNRLDLSTAAYEIFKKRKGFLAYVLKPFNAIYLVVAYVIAMVIFMIAFPDLAKLDVAESYNHPKMQWIYFYPLWMGIFIFISFLYQKYLLGFNLEKEHKTGLNKYRSEIIVGVLVAILTFLLTKLGEWIFT